MKNNPKCVEGEMTIRGSDAVEMKCHSEDRETKVRQRKRKRKRKSV